MAHDDSFDELARAKTRMEKIFKKIFSDSFLFSDSGEWVPPCDVYETDKNIIILVEIAGIDKKELKISFEGNYLDIKGFRDDPSKIDGKRNYYYMELNFGPFERQVFIPCPVRVEEAEVEYKNGILKIQLPKQTVGEKKEKIIEIE